MSNLLVDRKVLVSIKNQTLEKQEKCHLLIGIQAGSAILLVGTVPVLSDGSEWPTDAQIFSSARKIRRRLVGNVFIFGILRSSEVELKPNSSQNLQIQQSLASLRKVFSSFSSTFGHFYNSKKLVENAFLVGTCNENKNTFAFRNIENGNTVEHSVVDLSARGSWMKVSSRLCLNTTSASLVSLDDLESRHLSARLIGDILTTIFGDVSKKQARLKLLGSTTIVSPEASGSLSEFFGDNFVREVEILCQPFVMEKEFQYSEDAQYYRVAVAGDVEVSACFHSKFSTITDLYDGLMNDIVFSVSDLLSGALRSFEKDMENGENYCLLVLPKRVLPKQNLPEGESDVLQWCLADFKDDSEDADLEYIFHRDKVMNDIQGIPLPTKPISRAYADKNKGGPVSLDDLSCSSSYGAAMFFLGGFVLVILAMFIQSFLPEL